MFLRIAALMVLAGGLAACQTRGPTPYQPAADSSGQGGYSERWVDGATYEVTFSGNTQTDRETVETYTLYRAAELARERGFESFALLDRETEELVQRSYVYDPYYSPFYYHRYRYYPYRYGYRAYPYGYAPRPGFGYHPGFYGYGGRYVRRTVERHSFTAMAKVRLFNGEAPQGALRTFNAVQVLSELGPSVRRPAGAPAISNPLPEDPDRPENEAAPEG